MKNRAAIKALSTTAFFILVASLCVTFQHSRDIVKNVINSKKQPPPGLRKLLQQGEEVLADDDSDQVDCGDVHKQPGNETCSFVQNTDDCAIDEGFVNYLEVVYCTFSPALVPFGVFLFFVWWLFLFVGLAVTADEFFCPCLAIISKVLRLSHNIGVTLLAFGNGAPDVFSAISAIGNAKNGNAGLAFGALLGAGMFVTTVVTGAVAFVVPFHVMERPFLRDIAFYMMSLWFTFYILWHRKIHIAQAVAYLLIYAVYVSVVVIGRFIYQKHRARLNTNDDSIRGSIQERIVEEQEEDDVGAFPFGQSLEVPPVHGHNIQDDLGARPKKAVKDFARFAEQISAAAALGNAGGRALQPQISEMEEDADSEQTPLLGSQGADSSQWTEFLRAVNPINIEEWPEMRWYARAYEVFKSPLVTILKLTIPVVDKEQEKDNWNRPLATIHCITAPIACALLTNGVDKMVGSIPSGVFVLILGLLLALVVVWTSQNDQPPVYHSAFAFMGFVVAVIWIYSIANEIVNLLQMFGIVFGISNAILGLTLLAWGNSIGDLIADTVMARQGFPRMGISACFGGPLFNLLLGIGIPFTLGTIKQGSLTGVYEMTLDISLQEILLSIFLCFSLLSSFILLPILRFKIGKCYAIYLWSVYVVFLVMALLVETDVITADVTSWTI